jgi:NADPH:quinone reductase-like Zn-dependent oxidoreductase
MKAYVVESAGGPFREVEIPTPQPAIDQVLVKIRASGVNPDTRSSHSRLCWGWTWRAW